MKAWLKRVRPLVIAAAAAVAVDACGEQLNGGDDCPLCPPQQVTLEEDTLDAVELDTSIAGFPALGGELRFFVATLGDTLVTAAAIRIDSLPKFFRRVNTPDDSAIVFVDTGSYLRLTIATGDTLALPTTIEVYDIDVDGADDAPASVATAFTPDRLVGSRTVPADSLRDSVRVPIDPAFILAKIQDTVPMNRMRLGIRVAAEGNPRLSIIARNGGGATQLVFRPSPDTSTSVQPITTLPYSRTPADVVLADDLMDYLVVLKAPPEPPADVLRIGGLPARRAYLRFNIPSQILDSSNVVRATLLLTQRPNAFSPEAADTVGVGHFGVVSGSSVTDLTRALFFLQRLANRDTLRVLATDSGIRNFEMIDWVRAWRGTKPEKTPRAMALATADEGENPRQLDFYSIEAALELRPRLRITYLPRAAGPLP